MWEILDKFFEAMKLFLRALFSGASKFSKEATLFIRDDVIFEGWNFVERRLLPSKRSIFILSAIAVITPALCILLGVSQDISWLIVLGLFVSSIFVLILGFYIPFWAYVVASVFEISREIAIKLAKIFLAIVLWEMIICFYCLIIPVGDNPSRAGAVFVSVLILSLINPVWGIKSRLYQYFIYFTCLFFVVLGTTSMIFPGPFEAVSANKGKINNALSVKTEKTINDIILLIEGEKQKENIPPTSKIDKKGNTDLSLSDFKGLVKPAQEIKTNVSLLPGDRLKIEINEPINIGLLGSSEWIKIKESCFLPVKRKGTLILRGDKKVSSVKISKDV